MDLEKSGETLGSRVRAARELRGLTLRRLSAMTGLSAGFISQVEHEHSNASVASLKTLATALGVSTSELIEGGLKDSQGVLRKTQRPQVQMADGVTKFFLTRAPLRNLEICTAYIEPGGSTGAEHYKHGHSQEFVMCLSGRVELGVGEEKYTLEAGDCIEYLSSIVHGLRNLGDDTAEVLWVVAPPTS